MYLGNWLNNSAAREAAMAAGVTLGAPKASQFQTEDELKAQGIVGVYGPKKAYAPFTANFKRIQVATDNPLGGWVL